jgi:uncharacterized tellurite resistance protein B-like protein
MDKVDILRAACCVAGLDGKITEAEEHLLRRLKESAGVGEASFNVMCEMAIDERENYYEKQLEFISTDPEKIVRMLLQIARADDEVTQNERVIVQHLAEKIGVSEDRFEEIANE